jgi:hypothetical protein
MIWTNEYNLPGPYAQWIMDDQYDHNPDPNHYSATELTQPVRMTILTRRHRDEIVKDVSKCIKMAMGTACHKGIERASSFEYEYGEIEKRHSTKFGDVTVSGQVDWYSPTDRLVTDWKFTSVWAVMNQVKEEWNRQLNIYAHLLRANDRPVYQLQVGATCTDWRKGEKLQYGDKYPPIMYMPKPIELWWPSTTNDFISAVLYKMSPLHDVADDELPVCSPSERWLRGESWAAKRNANKRASRVFKGSEGETGADAWDYIKAQDNPNSWNVEYRPGSNVRCEDYCDVCEFCSFYKENVKCG